MTNHEDAAPGAFAGLKRVAQLVGGSVIAIFALGVMAGYTKAAIERGVLGWKALVVYAAASAILFLGLWIARKGVERFALAKSPKMREYQIIMAVTVLLGGVIGILMQVGAGPSHAKGLSALSYEASMTPAVSAVLLATLPLLAWLYYRWHKTADEHEQAAYNFGGMLSLYAYFFASIGWWTAWRGGLLPEPDGFAIFWMVITVWLLGWLWRRYR